MNITPNPIKQLPASVQGDAAGGTVTVHHVIDLEVATVWVRVRPTHVEVWTVGDCNRAFADGRIGHNGGWAKG